MIKQYRFAATQSNFTTADDQAENPLLRGYAIVFDKESELMSDKDGLFYETIAKDCKIVFDDTRSLWNHNSDMAIGAVFNSTLKLDRDATGISFELSPDRLDTRQLKTIQLGEARMSFGFYENSPPDKARSSDGKAQLRIQKNITVFEVSPVIFPAYSDTSVALRALQDNLEANDNEELELIRTKIALGLPLLRNQG